MQFCQQSFEDDNENMFGGIFVWQTENIKKTSLATLCKVSLS